MDGPIWREHRAVNGNFVRNLKYCSKYLFFLTFKVGFLSPKPVYACTNVAPLLGAGITLPGFGRFPAAMDPKESRFLIRIWAGSSAATRPAAKRPCQTGRSEAGISTLDQRADARYACAAGCNAMVETAAPVVASAIVPMPSAKGPDEGASQERETCFLIRAIRDGGRAILIQSHERPDASGCHGEAPGAPTRPVWCRSVPNRCDDFRPASIVHHRRHPLAKHKPTCHGVGP